MPAAKRSAHTPLEPIGTVPINRDRGGHTAGQAICVDLGSDDPLQQQRTFLTELKLQVCQLEEYLYFQVSLVLVQLVS